MDPLTIFGLVLTIVIAWWQYRRAERAEAKLDKDMKAMPVMIAQNVMHIFSATQPKPSEFDETLPSAGTSYADVDGDGEKELLIIYMIGPYSSALKIFKWQAVSFTSEFTVIGEIAPILGFEVDDFDFDGKEEIMTFQDDPDSGLPHAAGLHVNVLYKWNDDHFIEVSRRRDYTLEDVEERRRYIHGVGSE